LEKPTPSNYCVTWWFISRIWYNKIVRFFW
jgi:hypothetical protein